MDQTGTLREGEEFAGYRIVRKLGVGGMGEVYLASHPRLPREDAIKVLGAVDASDGQFRERFLRESDIAAGIDHPNVVSIHDRGVAGDRPWIAMSYIDGTDAARLLASAPGGLDPAAVAHIALDVADALDATNAQGILHRDVKPGNILLTERLHRGRPRVYLTDFGIAKAAGQAQSLTATSSFLGSISYCAPEQIAGTAGPATDQYALAATLFHLLTGREVFVGAHVGELLHQHLTVAPPRASGVRPSLPTTVDDVLARALAKDPTDRFASCSDFADALAAALDGTPPTAQWAPTTVNPVSAAHPPAPAAARQQAHPTPGPMWAPGLPGPRERRGFAAAAPLLAAETLQVTGLHLAAQGPARGIRKELADRWDLNGPVSPEQVRTAVGVGSYTVLTDPVLEWLRSANVVFGAHSPSGLRSAIADHLNDLTHESIVTAVLDVASERMLDSAARLPTTVSAWDCARSIQLVRKCVTVGYLQPADAWPLIAEFGDAAAVYPSWEAFAWGFEVGCAVEAGLHTSGKRAVRRSLDRTEPVVRSLLADPTGPWRAVPLH
ncbi:hypothetical protein nbrc107696_17870 [Gordonia spumicola]|uniref:non-specific serine/threonine protein kinase n=1 Tax=Gordonia spumicola TaxID=589161 RepID=A0A7I9V8B1_9ACTN|nr:protein kinase [Gordonia spumicola]GEE01341.1 hypothetical protein nbrc107696_17870 [Gordonia spumicola]